MSAHDDRTASPTALAARLAAAVSLSALLVACGGGGGIGSQAPYRAVPPPVTFSTSTIAVPAVPATGATPWSFGVGAVDASTGLYYLPDRTFAGVDVIDVAKGAFVTTITGGFAGATSSSTTSGPNGAILAGSAKLYATDGNGTVKVVSLATDKVTATIKLAGTKRVNKGAYDPDDGIVLVASDSDTTPFVSFISTATDTVTGTLAYPQTTGGLDASIYVSSMHAFLLSVPASKANKNGEIDVIDPVARKVTAVFPLAAACGPAGLAAGPNGELAVACSQPGTTYILGINDGHTMATINQAGGGDQAAYDATTNRFYIADSNNTDSGTKTGNAQPVLTVIDAATLFYVQNVPTEAKAHAVSAAGGTVIVPRPSTGVALYR